MLRGPERGARRPAPTSDDRRDTCIISEMMRAAPAQSGMHAVEIEGAGLLIERRRPKTASPDRVGQRTSHPPTAARTAGGALHFLFLKD